MFSFSFFPEIFSCSFLAVSTTSILAISAAASSLERLRVYPRLGLIAAVGMATDVLPFDRAHYGIVIDEHYYKLVIEAEESTEA